MFAIRYRQLMEMLVSSSPGMLELLPALPKELEKGVIRGVKGRNQVTIENLTWNMETGIINCTLKSAINQPITLIERQGINDVKTHVKVSSSSLGKIARTIQLKAGISTNISMRLDK